MANPFDQFDPATNAANPFDQFDAAPNAAGSQLPAWLFEHGQRANILRSFGQGAEQGWGAEPLGLSDESESFLKKAGIFNDAQEGHQSWLRTFNEAMIRPAAIGLDATLRAGTALFRGTQAGIEALGEYAAHPPPGLPGPLSLAPGLAHEAAAIPEAFPRGEAELGIPAAAPPIERSVPPEATAAAIRALTPPDLTEARSLGVIGEGEAGWKGITEPVPEDAENARAASIRQMREAAPMEEGPPVSLPEPAPPAPDIHSVARQIAPDVFQEYDGLRARQDIYRRQLDDMRGGSELDEMDRGIDELRGQRLLAEPGERAGLANAITAMEGERSRLDDILRAGNDTPAMAQIRQALQQNDYRMRDLAPDVSAAYREAQARMPPPAPAEPVYELGGYRIPASTPFAQFERAGPAAAEPVQAPEAQPAPEAAPTETAPQAGAAAEPEMPPRVVPSIHDDAYGQLVAAGRPPEEAHAAAALVAAHYDARAARFEGALGTPEELYAREAPTVERGAGVGAVAGRTVLRDGEATIRLMGRADASTFIHETGHAWLEELMRDAAHEAAPEDLTKDAATVRGWLGVGEDEAVPTRAHEKFARGFERYMMEGRAPNAALAGVFDRFKQWLTNIYQTIARLRAPITDDIRDVFDRLLSLPGREPVIAEDMTIPQDFAAEHEGLAERTAPEVAAGAADRVRAEADRVALEKAPEVYHELGGRAAATEPEAPGNAPADLGPDHNGPAAGPEPGATPTPEPVGAERAGRGEAAAQGPGLAGGAAATGDANAGFARNSESPLVDRAGNIRLDLLGTPEDVSQVIRDAAAENNEFLGARRGIISDAEVLRLADALGMDASQLNRRKLGQAFNAEEVTAARKLLVQSANAVHEAMKAAAVGDDAAVLAYAAARDRHLMIQSQVAGLTAEAGRALRAFAFRPEGMAGAEQIGAFLEEATGRTLNQLRREARKGAALDTPSKVSGFVAKAQEKPRGVFDWIQSAFINFLISGPQTHATYTVANKLLAVERSTVETGAQALVGRVRTGLGYGSPQDRVVAGEMKAQLYSMWGGERDGWRASWDAFRTNETVLLPGETRASTTPFGKNVIPNPEIAGVRIPIGTVIEAPSRVVTALHTQQRVSAYTVSIARQAYRMASNEGLSGDRFAARIAQLTKSPTDEMMQVADEEGNVSALMQRSPYGSFTNMLSRWTNYGIPIPDIPLGFGHSIPMGTLRPIKFVDPFVQISANIIKSAIVDRTPLGILSPTIRADLSGANGGVAFDLAAGKMLAGSSFYLVAGGLAAEGLITGSEPDDYRKAMMKRMTGWQAHSVKIGDIYYAANRLGVLGMALGIGADLYDVVHQAATEDFATAAASAVHAFSQNILDESFMRGPSELIRALTDHERYGAAFVRSFLSSFVPFSVGAAQIARTIDPYTRQARTITDAMLRKIPWASETLYPMRDIWGEPMPNRESPLPGVTAIYESRINNDPVNQRMVALGMGPALPERKIRGIELTEGQYDDYSRVAGRMAKVQLDKIIPAPGFTQMPETVQKEIISRTIAGAREGARSLIMMQNPSIMQQAIAAKTAALHQNATLH